jgi:hypothetical protein
MEVEYEQEIETNAFGSNYIFVGSGNRSLYEP